MNWHKVVGWAAVLGGMFALSIAAFVWLVGKGMQSETKWEEAND